MIKMAVGKKATAKPAVVAKKVALVKISKAKRHFLSNLRKTRAAKNKQPLKLKPGKTERKGKELAKKTPRRFLLTGKYQPPHTIRVNKQIFVGNLDKKATEKDIMAALPRFHRYIKSVRVLRSNGTGKKAPKDAEGKKIKASRGAAFIRLRTRIARDNLLKLKKLEILGKTVVLSKSAAKKSHQAMLAHHKTRKALKAVTVRDEKKIVKEKMQENMTKNKKLVKSLKKKTQKKKSSKTDTKKDASKPKTLSLKHRRLLEKKEVGRNERKKLSGFKARKAMSRRSTY